MWHIEHSNNCVHCFSHLFHGLWHLGIPKSWYEVQPQICCHLEKDITVFTGTNRFSECCSRDSLHWGAFSHFYQGPRMMGLYSFLTVIFTYMFGVIYPLLLFFWYLHVILLSFCILPLSHFLSVCVCVCTHCVRVYDCGHVHAKGGTQSSEDPVYGPHLSCCVRHCLLLFPVAMWFSISHPTAGVLGL